MAPLSFVPPPPPPVPAHLTLGAAVPVDDAVDEALDDENETMGGL